ncbi:MAG: hypothetical protein IT383_06595 [Deltaproteobacteria bacterium]|nr:hypothetical protein [Deltaproteobacteria bacterium]
MRTTVVMCALALSSCTLFLEGELAAIRAQLEDEAEGEGEGDEGEGEGEGELPDSDPRCEEQERLIVIRDDPEDAVRVYRFTPGAFLRIFPAGTTDNVVVENDDPNAINNGYSLSGGTLDDAGNLWLVGDRFLYRMEASTLTQGQVAGRQQLTLSAFGSFSSVVITPGHIVAVGSDAVALAKDAQAGDTVSVIEDSNDYHRGVAFPIDGLTFVAGVATDGFGVWQTAGLALPAAYSVIGNRDDRFDTFGGSVVSRGIAFDPITRKLLLGNVTGIVVTPYDQGFGVPDVDTDWSFPDDAQAEAAAIGARAGKAYVAAAYRSTDNIFQLDLAFTPPRALDVGSVGDGGRATSLAVGCRRMVLGSAGVGGGIWGLTTDGLEAAGAIADSAVEQVFIVRRDALGLAGDE